MHGCCRAVAFILAGSLSVSACDSPVGTEDTTLDGLRLTIVSGDQQSAFEHTQLAAPLVAQLINSKGRPVKGQVVSFRTVIGGGGMWAGAASTDGDGIVRDWWTLGSAGLMPALVEARTIDPATGLQLVLGTFSATATPLLDAYVECRYTGQADFTPHCGTFNSPPSMANGQVLTVEFRVRNGDGAPVPSMMFEFLAANATVSTGYALTNADGIVLVQFTVGQDKILTTIQAANPATGLFDYADFKAGY